MKFLIFLSLIILPIQGFTQYFPSFTDKLILQPSTNKMYLNAAATGYNKKKTLFISGSNFSNLNIFTRQSAGINTVVSYQQPVINSRSSIGLVANYSLMGSPVNYKYFASALSYSYNVAFDNEEYFRVGIQAGIKYIDFKFESKFPGGFGEDISGIAPFTNVGLFYNTKTFYLGISLKSIFQQKMKTNYYTGHGQRQFSFVQYPSLNYMVGNTFFESRKLAWKPEFLLIHHFDNETDRYIQLSNTFILNKQISGGFSYIFEHNESFVFHAGFRPSDWLEISFSRNLLTYYRQFTNVQGNEVTAKVNF